MTTFLFWLVFWVVCAVIAYLLVRREQRRTGGGWTQMDRLFGVSVGLMYGPFLLITIAFITLAGRINKTRWAKREARW